MAGVGKLRRLYRVAILCFCVIFACSYHGDTSDYSRLKYKAKPSKLKQKFKAKSLSAKHDVRLKGDQYASSLTEDVKQAVGGVEQKKLKLPKIKRSGKFKKLEKVCFNLGKRQCLIYNFFFRKFDYETTAPRCKARDAKSFK